MDLFYDICNKNTEIMRRGLPLLTLTWRSVDEAESVSTFDEVGVDLVSSDGSSSRFSGTSRGSLGSNAGSSGISGGSSPVGTGVFSDLTGLRALGGCALVVFSGLHPASVGLGDSGSVGVLGSSRCHRGGASKAGMFLCGSSSIGLGSVPVLLGRSSSCSSSFGVAGRTTRGPDGIVSKGTLLSGN